jgi:hypothetical protein
MTILALTHTYARFPPDAYVENQFHPVSPLHHGHFFDVTSNFITTPNRAANLHSS